VGGELKNTKTRNRYAMDISKLPSFHEVGGWQVYGRRGEGKLHLNRYIGSNFNVSTSIN
jgi:hypothetical protein